MAKISQREARRLRKRVTELEGVIDNQRSRWHSVWPGGVNLGQITREKDWLTGRIQAARMLGHAVVVTENEGVMQFYACPLAKG